ncbi:MAG: NAD(P)H-dependent oxidoreductase [Candidatus Cloacimonetes bacterium]|nr:NAD(P)H-dependent oxidoreductase [Candidatus Cloacimonadota bacterium]MCF8012755.1 NAD(P)H-dependent oxidoreductase [Candidatus Woesearchaeota archaeon]
MEFNEIINKRYATKLFNKESIAEDKIEKLKEMIKLSASSFGLQPFKVVIVKDQEIKDKLLPASWNQPQIGSCSHLLIFCAYKNVDERIDEYENMLKATGTPKEKFSVYINMMRDFSKNTPDDRKLIWAQKQCYIALGNALNGAKALGFDSCPMEGFSPEEYAKILELSDDLVPTIVCPIGYAADEPRPKLRFSDKDLFVEL